MTGRPPVPKFIGSRVRRREDPDLITGRSRFVADIHLENMLFLGLWRSPMAHARIASWNRETARSLPGVRYVLDASDLRPFVAAPFPSLTGAIAGRYSTLKVPERFPLAQERARYVGEPVIAVLAESPELAADALERIEVHLEPLPAVTSAAQALADNALLVHDECEGNVTFDWIAQTDDVDRAFAESPVVVEFETQIQRLIPTALEPRAVLATFDSHSERFTLWSTTQIPHLLRADVAQILGVEPQSIRVIAPDVGGGFGAKANVYPEEALALLLARNSRRPVKWVATRSEDAVATTQGRGQHNRMRLAADRAGRVQAIDLEVRADCGAYLSRVTAAVTPSTGLMSTGVYDIRQARARTIGALTHKPPIEPYRGAGRPEAAYMIERGMDVLADRLNLDPVEVRRRNFVAPERFPYRTALGLTYDSGNYALTLERALELVDYPGLRLRQAELLAAGNSLLGIGIACYVEICGFGPWEAGEVMMREDGSVVARTGTSPHGQGHETSWAQIVADTLQIPMERILVVHGDTDEVPAGIGTFGSRSAAVGGCAMLEASESVREGAKAIAAHLLEAAVEDLRLQDGRFFVVGVPDRSVGWEQVAAAAHSEQLPVELRGRLAARKKFKPQGETYPFGTHVCVVAIDTQSGQVTIERYLSVDDCGRVINPLLVEGQIQGGAVQGIGQALCEAAVYDPEGMLLSPNLVDYALPRADMLPSFESHRTETPSPLNPLGIKGIGEAATIGSTPAVVNAVVDALSHLGIEHLDTPLTPVRIWEALRASRSSL